MSNPSSSQPFSESDAKYAAFLRRYFFEQGVPVGELDARIAQEMGRPVRKPFFFFLSMFFFLTLLPLALPTVAAASRARSPAEETMPLAPALLPIRIPARRATPPPRSPPPPPYQSPPRASTSTAIATTAPQPSRAQHKKQLKAKFKRDLNLKGQALERAVDEAMARADAGKPILSFFFLIFVNISFSFGLRGFGQRGYRERATCGCTPATTTRYSRTCPS